MQAACAFIGEQITIEGTIGIDQRRLAVNEHPQSVAAIFEGIYADGRAAFGLGRQQAKIARNK